MKLLQYDRVAGLIGLGILARWLLFLPALWAQTCPLPPPAEDRFWFGIRANAAGPLTDNGVAVSAMAANGDIYVAGEAGQDVKVARWDGTRWAYLGERLSFGGGQTQVTAIAVAANGDVYLGGNFTLAYNAAGQSPETVLNVARWDAAAGQWTAVGEGAEAPVTALAMDNPNNLLYVGGPVTAYNPGGTGVTLNGTGRWNINQGVWEPAGQGIGGQFPLVYDVIVDNNGDAFFCGVFETVTNPNGTQITVNGIARWDGTVWHPLGQGLSTPGLQPYPNSMARSLNGDTLFVGGRFQFAVNGDGTTVPGPVVAWDGSLWRSLNHPPVFNLYHLAVDGSSALYSLYIDPNFNGPFVDRRAGSGWTTIGSFFAEFVATLAAHIAVPGANLYAGGLYSQILNPVNGQIYATLNNAYFNGLHWREMVGQGGVDGSVFALETNRRFGDFPSLIYAGGNFNRIANVPAHNIAAYDGVSWTPIANGVNGAVYDIAYEPNIPLWTAALWVIGGMFTEAYNADGSSVPVNHVAIWDGSGWSSLGGGVNGPVYAVLPDAFVFGGTLRGRIIVGGQFTIAFNPNGDPVAANSIAAWNLETGQWESLGQGITGGVQEVRVIVKGGRPFFGYYAGGFFNGGINPDGSVINSSNIVYWNGLDSWLPVGQGVDGRVIALETGPPFTWPGPGYITLYVGGDFQQSINSGGAVVSTPYLSVWSEEDAQWFPVQGGVNGPVHSIDLSERYSAIIGGEFTLGLYPNGNARGMNHIGRFSLTEAPTWFALGPTGIDDVVYAVANVGWCRAGGQNIYAGGDFTQAGFRTAPNLARWRYQYQPCYTGVNAVSGMSGGGGEGSIAMAHSGPSCSPLVFSPLLQEPLIDSLAFREKVILDSLYLNQYFDLIIHPPGDPGNPLAVLDSLLIGDSRNPGLLVFTGVGDTNLYAPNPEGRSIALNTLIRNYNTMVAQGGDVQLIFTNGVTDAPTVNIAFQGGAILADSLAYGESAEQISLAPGNYTFDVIRTSNGQILGSYSVDLSGYTDQVALLLLSGFLDPGANQNGPAMSLDVFETGVGTVVVGVELQDEPKNVSEGFQLFQNYPNPFNPETRLRFRIADFGLVKLKIYDVLGREVTTLVNKKLMPGEYEVQWNGSNDASQPVASGVYFYRLHAGDQFVQTRKMILLR